MDAPPDPPVLSVPQLFSFQVSYTSRSDYRNSLLPEGSKKGEWRHGILEVDFPMETFFLQDRDRILLSQTFSSFNKHGDFGSSEGSSLALKFNSDHWEIVAQNIAEKYCIQHLLDCIVKSIPVDDVVQIGKEKGIIGLDNSIIKHGKVQRKAVNQNRLDERYIILVPGKLFVFKSYNIKGKHVRYVTSVLGATVRMLPEEQEFQILAPGSKTMSLIPETPEEFHSWVEALGTSISHTKQAVDWLDSLRKEGEKQLETRSNNKTEYQNDMTNQDQFDGSKLSTPSGEIDQDGTSGQESRRDVLESLGEIKNTADTIKSPRGVQYEAPFQWQGRLGLQQIENNKEVRRFDYSQCCRSKQSKAMMYLENALDEMENMVGNIKRGNIEKNKKSKPSWTSKEKDLRCDREKERDIVNGDPRVSNKVSISQTGRKWPKCDEYGPSCNVRHSIDDSSLIGRGIEMPELTKYGKNSHDEQNNVTQGTEFRKSFSGVAYHSPPRVSCTYTSQKSSTNLQCDPSNENSYGPHSDRGNTYALKPKSPRISNNEIQPHTSSSEGEEDEEEELQENWRRSGGGMPDALRITSENRKLLVNAFPSNVSLEQRSTIPSRTLTDCSSMRAGSKFNQKGRSAEGTFNANQCLDTCDQHRSPVQPKINSAQKYYRFNASKDSYDTPQEYKPLSPGLRSINSDCQPKTPRMTGNQPSNYVFHQSSSGSKEIQNPSEKRSFDYKRGLKEIPKTEFKESKNPPLVISNDFSTLHDPVYDPEFSGPQIINRKHSSRSLQQEKSFGNRHANGHNKDDYLDREQVPNTHGHLRNEPLPDTLGEESNLPYRVNDGTDSSMFTDDHARVGIHHTRQTISSCSLEAWQHGQPLSSCEPELQLEQTANNKRDLQGYKANQEEILANRTHSISLQLDGSSGNDGSMSARGVNSDTWWSPSRPGVHGLGTTQGGMTSRSFLGRSNNGKNHDENRDLTRDSLEFSMVAGAGRS